MRKLALLLIPLLLLSVNFLSAQGDQPAGDADNALIIADVLPADGSDGVDPEATITVIFNRPVVPLTIAEEMDDLPDPLTITPAVEGEGEWLNTSIYIFRPDTALAGGTTYTVTVDDVTAVDGATLAEPYTWSFTTVSLAVSEVVPFDGTAEVVLDETVQVRFNQPVERASVESAFYLRNTETNELASGTFEWADDSAGFRFIPDDQLELDTIYEAGFAANTAQGAAGGDPMAQARAWTFSTVPFPEVVSTVPRDREQNAYPYGGFTIFFASPMDIDSLEGKIEIDPEPWREFDAYYGDWDNSYTLSFPTEPSTNYTITIEPGMRDIYGNEITEATVIRYRTAPYDPDVMLQVPGPIGFYNGNNEQTQLFLTHRNVSEIDLELYGMDTSTFLSLNDNYYSADQINPADLELLRQWTIESVAPLNARRYELLNLGGTQAVDCPGAPESRLMVGDSAIVVATDALRARQTPPDGEIVTLLYRDYRLPVVGGPVCDNGMLWWEVTLRDDRRAWVAEGTIDEYFLDLGSAAERTPVDVADADGEALPPGVYMLRVTAPETSARGYSPTTHMIVVGTANLTFKNAIGGALVWATDVNTGLPIPDAPITIYDAAGVEVGGGVSDDDGLLELDLPDVPDLYRRRSAVIDTDDYFGVTYSGWSDGIEGWNFGQFSNYYPERYRGYLYTDRPIYRPDQPVYFRGILRARDDVRYTPTTMGTVDVQITDPEGQIVYQKKLPLSEYGTYSDQFNLDPDAALGYYRIGVTLPGDRFDTGEGGSVTFGVAEYRVPEFEVTVSTQTPEVVQGDTITLTIDSRYYFGGVVSGANVEYNVVAQPYFFEYEGGNYSFIDFDADTGASEIYSGGGGLVTSGEGVTDASGQLVIEIPADLDDATQSQQYTVEAVVSDESGQAVAGRTSVIVHKGLVYIGVQPENYVSTSGEETTFNLIAVDWDGEPVAEQAIDVEVVERRWSSVQEQDELGRTTWTYEVEEIPITSGDVTTDAQGRASFTFTPPNGGVFKLKASARDEAGNEVISAATAWVSGREYVAWRQQNSNRIDLIADRAAYEVGDTAEILITSPFQGAAEALVTVERGGILTAERITLDTNSYVYQLPIEEAFAPNVYVTVMLVKGVDATNPVAAFRMGMVQLAVDNERKQITIEIEPDVEQAGPGDTVTYTVRTTDVDGEPVQAEVGVGLSDLASLSIADPNSQPLLTFFYGQQGLIIS